MDTRAHEQAFQQGDRTAFAALVQHHQGPMLAFLGRMGLPNGQAQDLAQDAFVQAWQHRARFMPERAAWSTWVFTIARNLALDALRSPAQRQQPWPEDEAAQWVCPAPAPDEQLAHRQLRLRVQQGLRALPLADRSALALAYIDDLSVAEAARIEGCSPGAMKVRIHRARQRLRDWLETHP